MLKNLFRNFLKDLKSYSNGEIGLPEIRSAIKRINEFLYQTTPSLGTTITLDGDEFPYFSEFHKFWESHHQEIIGARINEEQARKAAECLSKAVQNYGEDILRVTQDTKGLSEKAVAEVRFFTANQDFRKPPKDPYGRYLEDPAIFDVPSIEAAPEDFLKSLGMVELSQSDKRIDFARNAARFLSEKGIDAYKIAEYFGNDAQKIRDALISYPNMGYGNKKANMFIRDMYVMGVWLRLKNMEVIDVASDINTMKLALRTKVLETEIPLVSSFLDIFCHQYTHIDTMSASAWRAVWEMWKRNNPENVPLSPCLIDFILYRIGREYCNEMVSKYQCLTSKIHTFYYFGRRLRSCLICRREGKRSKAEPQDSFLPCQVTTEELPKENGDLMLGKDNLLKTFDGRCIFESVCEPKSADFRKFAPPKSISIKGRTSWTESYAYKDEGGGGMMG